MTKTQVATQTDQVTCEYCQGRGSLSGVHVWSDGPSMVDYVCPLCHGTGVTGNARALLDRLIQAEKGWAQAAYDLDRARTYIALYLLQQAGKLGPSFKSNFAIAPRPASWGWEENVKREARLAPRVKEAK